MPLIALKAHFDGEQILLDEAFDLPVGADLIVTVVLGDERDIEFRRNWSAQGKRALGRVYGDDEPEYSIQDCRLRKW